MSAEKFIKTVIFAVFATTIWHLATKIEVPYWLEVSFMPLIGWFSCLIYEKLINKK